VIRRSEMKFNEKRYIYLYGKDYDYKKEKPDLGATYSHILIHWNLKRENERVLSSLEGIFITNKPIADEEASSPGTIMEDWQLSIPHTTKSMQEFEEKYQGKFISFGK
jgi:hypothetical protein